MLTQVLAELHCHQSAPAVLSSPAGAYCAAMPESQDASCDGPTGHLELSQELDQIDLCPITLDDINDNAPVLAEDYQPQVTENTNYKWVD